MATKGTRKEIEISQNIALHHIYSQAGSVEKALSEGVMNAVDAKADEIRITIADDGIHYVMADNGKGFASEEEITECFGTLGFDHNTAEQQAKERTFGAFGLGRAQLWAWSRNTWKSGPYEMAVDIEEYGLAYDLTEDDSRKVKGCVIEGEFYKPLLPMDVANIMRELKTLTQYMDISIYFNDELISKPMSKMKWDRTTDEAYFKLKEHGGLTLYNQGMLVRDFPSSKFGVSGVVVSRKNLTLNVARNDVMLNRCEVFPEIEKVLKEEAKKIRGKSDRSLSDRDRVNMFRQIMARPEENADLWSRNIIKAVDGKFYSLSSVVSKFSGTITFGDHDRSPIGEMIMHNCLALVISPSFMDEVNFPSEDVVKSIQRANNRRYMREKIEEADYKELSSTIDSTVKRLDPKKLPKKKKAALKALERLNQAVCSAIERHVINEDLLTPGNDSVSGWRSLPYLSSRTIYLGELQGATAWTDGARTIGYDHDALVNSFYRGESGFWDVAHVLAHEYAHSGNSSKDHSHGLEFYEQFHHFAQGIHEAYGGVLAAVNLYAKELVKSGLVVPNMVASSIKSTAAREGLIKEMEKRDLLAPPPEAEASVVSEDGQAEDAPVAEAPATEETSKVEGAAESAGDVPPVSEVPPGPAEPESVSMPDQEDLQEVAQPADHGEAMEMPDENEEPEPVAAKASDLPAETEEDVFAVILEEGAPGHGVRNGLFSDPF